MSAYKEQLTVAELIEELKKMPPGAYVWHEGCDCFGAAGHVEVDEEGSVLITRVNS